MNWKFWRHREAARTIAPLDPDSVAYEGTRLVVLGRNFLDYWRKFNSELPSDVIPYLERCVWTYQLQILCDEASRRFNPIVGDSVKGNVLKYFSLFPGSVSGEHLFEAVTRGRAADKPGLIFPDAPDAEGDLVIANAFFEISDISEERKTGIWLGFAKCLDIARIAAEKELASFLDGVSISETSSLIWTRNPGCFERHLQRRFQNPLFDASRREVSRREVQGARAHDLKDAFAIVVEYRELLPQLMSGAESTVHEADKTLKHCHALKLRMAQVGGDWGFEKEMLDIACREIQKLISTAAADPRLDEVSRSIAALHATQQIPYVAQTARDDTPIPRDEAICALLTEDLETIRAFAMVAAASRWDIRVEAQSIVDRARKEGLPQAYADERLNVLEEAWATGGRLAAGAR